MIVKIQRHHQMADHDLIGLVTVALAERTVVELVFLKRALHTAGDRQCGCRCQVDQIQKALEQRIKLIVLHIADDGQMTSVVTVDKGL